MKNTWNKICRTIATLLAVLIVLEACPLDGFAYGSISYNQAQKTSSDILTADLQDSDVTLTAQENASDSAAAPEEKKSGSRSLGELKESENVVLSDDGEILSVKISEADQFTDEELRTMLESMAPFKYSGDEAIKAKDEADKKNMYDRFGLSEEEVELGSKLHGSVDVLLSELDYFDLSKNNIDLTKDIQLAIITLIKSGYTNSQAFAAYVASDVLGLTIEELAEIKINEIEAEQRDSDVPSGIMTAGTQDKTAEEQNDDYLALATKMGIPYSVIENYMSKAL